MRKEQLLQLLLVMVTILFLVAVVGYLQSREMVTTAGQTGAFFAYI